MLDALSFLAGAVVGEAIGFATAVIFLFWYGKREQKRMQEKIYVPLK